MKKENFSHCADKRKVKKSDKCPPFGLQTKRSGLYYKLKDGKRRRFHGREECWICSEWIFGIFGASTGKCWSLKCECRVYVDKINDQVTRNSNTSLTSMSSSHNKSYYNAFFKHSKKSIVSHLQQLKQWSDLMLMQWNSISQYTKTYPKFNQSYFHWKIMRINWVELKESDLKLNWWFFVSIWAWGWVCCMCESALAHDI